MNSVWIVEEGEYSYYHVVAIFSTREQAESFCSHRPESTCREWILDTWREEAVTFKFRFDLQGRITETTEEAFTEDVPADCAVDNSWRHEKNEIQISVNRGPRELAVKIASELYTRIRAFIDEADLLVARARYDKNGNYRFDDALKVARILAGLDRAPDPPQCTHHENILTILAVKTPNLAALSDQQGPDAAGTDNP